MKSFKNGRWIIPFKKFSRLRVKPTIMEKVIKAVLNFSGLFVNNVHNAVLFILQPFMSPRYPGGPRGPGIRMPPDQFNVSITLLTEVPDIWY